MNVTDMLLIGVPLLGGTLLVGSFADRAIRAGAVARVSGTITSFHGKLTGWLVSKGLLRIPGIALVPPDKGWLSGEAVFLVTLSLAAVFRLNGMGVFRLFPVALLLGIATAVLSLKSEARNRLEEIRRALPTASYLMSLLLEAGMGSHAALQEVARALPKGSLPDELDEITRSRMLGVQRVDALERSRSRIPMDDYRLFVNLIHQGERLGVGLSRGLRELSSKMLENQEHRAETLAQKAAVKLLFPLVVFIFPSVFLIILSPVILSLWETWGK